VTTIDEQGVPPGSDLIIKIDVEGTELDVINGAERTLSQAHGFVIVMEAHRHQVARSGIDTSTIVKRVAEIAPVDVLVSEGPDRAIDLDRPFFDQVPEDIYHVCLIGKPSPA